MTPCATRRTAGRKAIFQPSGPIRRPPARVIAVLAIPALLAACASTPKVGGDPGLAILAGNDLPAPDRLDLTKSTAAYYVGPFDRLAIDVFGIEELSERSVQVSASGEISFPLVGEVQVAGQTPNEIASVLAQKLRANFVRDPQVTVNLVQTGNQLVTVEGQVMKPGLYPVAGRMTLLRAMAVAGGTTEFSLAEQVVVFRTVKGERLAALYNLEHIRRGAYPDPEVYANDVIVVDDNKARRLFKDVLAILPAAVTPLVIGLDRLAR